MVWLLLPLLLLGAFAAAFVLVAAMPETANRRPGALASMRPRVNVPRSARGAFARALSALVAPWALGGFYLSRGRSLAPQLTHSHDLLWGGGVAFLVTGVGAAAALTLRNRHGPAQMLGGCLALMVGAGVTIAAIETESVATLGSAVTGIVYGTAILGAYRTVVAQASPSDRAALIAAIFSVTYLASGLPAVIAGITPAHVGLHRTALAYLAAVAGLAAVATGTFLYRGNSRTYPPAQSLAAPSDLCPGPCTVPAYVPSPQPEAEPAKVPT